MMTKIKQKEDELKKAEEVLRKAHKQKIDMCSAEIEEVLKRYGFELRVSSRIVLNPIQ